MNKYGITFPHPASVYLAAAHNHPAMALAAMANTASIISATTAGSSNENLFVNTSALNDPFSSTPGMNHLFNQNVTTVSTSKSGENKKEGVSSSSIASPISVQPMLLNAQTNKVQETTTSALKAALQVSDHSSFSADLKLSTSKYKK